MSVSRAGGGGLKVRELSFTQLWMSGSGKVVGETSCYVGLRLGSGGGKW